MLTVKQELRRRTLRAKARTTEGYDLQRIRERLGVRAESAESLAASVPFGAGDTTAGAENELQTVVVGAREQVDFCQCIERSNYYQNILKRARSGDTSPELVTGLELFLKSNPDKVWENSWVRFPRTLLSPYARQILAQDLLADKKNPDGPRRRDADKFLLAQNQEKLLRIPVSYLLKLALADAISAEPQPHPLIKTTATRVLGHFLNDNSSPETFSFHPVWLHPKAGMGEAIASECARRFLLSQLLTGYANRKFELVKQGQEAMIYFAPHPHTRQKEFNELVTDGFYREMFMSPCLSGWDRGEEKYDYMRLCHKVLSRSQLNAVAKLKEAGIITRNLVVLPTVSNISLANNGTHISLGSHKLGQALKSPDHGFTDTDERYLGDLVIKIAEHFLPLFVGTYSAAPYRLDFCDFHPEKVLGFLPHELDFTHLRMLWRRWRKKACSKVLGRACTPFGPKVLDRWFSRVFGLKGDFVHDFRLIDYLVALLSTDQSPGLNGSPEGENRLKQDLADLGVFDPRMPLYLLYRLRKQGEMGFSGFEGRYYSLFENFSPDMARATDLQTLITALAWQYVLSGEITHADIPDTPFVESERRQIFFGAAIGIPTFYIHQQTPNRLIRKVFSRMPRTRTSRRYPAYFRAHNLEYRRALIQILKADGAELICSMKLEESLRDLEFRLANPGQSTVSARLTRGILDGVTGSDPMALSSREFNMAAERYYRGKLRERHMAEALDLLEGDLRRIDAYAALGRGPYREVLADILGEKSASEFLHQSRREILDGSPALPTLRRLIHLCLLVIHGHIRQFETIRGEKEAEDR